MPTWDQTEREPVNNLRTVRGTISHPLPLHSTMDDYPLPNYDAEHVWMLDGHCRGREPSFFFPSDGVGVDIARKVCAGCPVQAECLEYALQYRIEHGVWGGASERERRRILRARRLSAHS
jgi:WhiB family redox-sensing transcriptional regulator